MSLAKCLAKSFMVQIIAFVLVGSSSSQAFRKEDITVSVLDCTRK